MSAEFLTILPLGGGNEIGANCYYIHWGGTGIVLDVGIHPKKEGLESLPDFSQIYNAPVDDIILTHAHQDHIGALPFFIREFPHTRIMATYPTAIMARIALHNSIRILREQLIKHPEFKIYSHEEVELMLRTIRDIAYRKPFQCKGFSIPESEAIEAELYDSGHILGSCGVRLQKNGHSFFYTGDINLRAQSIEVPAQRPPGKVHTLLVEATLGATDPDALPDWDEECSRLARECNRIFSKNGSVLIPVFAIGKTQELLSVIWKLMEEGKMMKVPIYTGGIGRKVAKIYDKFRYMVPVQNPRRELKDIPQIPLNGNVEYHSLVQEPCIVLASSGMMVHRTASYNIAKVFLRNPYSAICTVGYMDEESPGYRIAHAKQGDKIRLTDYSEETRVQCEILNFRFTSHARRDDLLEYIFSLHVDNVVLTHGDADAVAWMGEQILRENRGIRVFAAEPGKKIEIPVIW
ncbi:MAG: MBL fold metallo-hydrolase [Ignavibacteria bacterium]|nr:MBL fold metallo-hydrolase [Ignavibacteria bacterium]